MFSVSPQSRDQIKQVQQAFRKLPKEIKNDFRKYQRQALNPIWREEMAATSGGTEVRQTIFKSGNRTKAGAPAYLIAGASNRAMSGGGTPSELARAYEFGSNTRENYTKYRRKNKNGGSHTVTRRTRRQLPAFKKAGWTVFPASRAALPRIASLHVQTLYKKIHLAIEGK